MGDIALTMPPVIEALREAYPEMILDVLTTSAGASLLRDANAVDEIVIFDPPWSVPAPGKGFTPIPAYLWRSLKFIWVQLCEVHRRYEAIVYLSFSPWERILVSLRGRCRVGFSGPYTRPAFRLSSRLLTASIPFDTTRHMLDNSFDLVRVILPEVRKRNVSLMPVSTGRREHGRALLEGVGAGGTPIVLFHAGTAASMKAWPIENFIKVAEKLKAEFSIEPVFVGTSDEIEYCAFHLKLARLISRSLCVTPSVDDLVSVVANAKVLVANDGGPMHIAASLGISTVAVFGPTDERVYGPRGARCRVVRQDGICGRRQTPWHVDPCCAETGKECLAGIQVETVWNAVRSVL